MFISVLPGRGDQRAADADRLLCERGGVGRLEVAGQGELRHPEPAGV